MRGSSRMRDTSCRVRARCLLPRRSDGRADSRRVRRQRRQISPELALWRREGPHLLQSGRGRTSRSPQRPTPAALPKPVARRPPPRRPLGRGNSPNPHAPGAGGHYHGRHGSGVPQTPRPHLERGAPQFPASCFERGAPQFPASCLGPGRPQPRVMLRVPRVMLRVPPTITAPTARPQPPPGHPARSSKHRRKGRRPSRCRPRSSCPSTRRP